MQDAAERLVNLALYLASIPRPTTAEECRSAGLGYPEGQDNGAFIRMFERDKDALRAMGLVIEVSSEEETEGYRLDAAATYARPVNLDPEELAAIKAVAAAFANDPGFPFGDDLVPALAKIGATREDGPMATTELAQEVSAERSLDVRALAEAVQTRKTVTFGYTNAAGEQRSRRVDPYGIFFREGVWYLTGRDRDADAIRTYAVTRIRDLDVNPMAPRTPDFTRPTDFDVRDHERLPFQCGQSTTPARIRFEPEVAWRAERLARGRGTIDVLVDGSALWTVDVANVERLASWIVDAGTGLHAVDPPELITALSAGLRRVVDGHG